jgi:pimeloyl-ACP methyl ester carboxylesterase
MNPQSGPIDESSVLIDGPWEHRFISANGSRFHVVEAGTGPLVLFMHGFPEFWWVWRHQLHALAEAGYRAVAVDIRGYGATDKPPRGYDGYTMAADAIGLIRALGERSATLVGSGYGGMMAWTTASFHPKMVDRLIISGAAHPLRLRAALLTDPRGQSASAMPVLKFQIPRYEHVLTRDDAALVGQYLRTWCGPDFVGSSDFAEYERKCRTAMQIPQTSFCALEAYRWAFRSVLRLHGYRFVKLLQQPINAPTLQLHGAVDGAVLPRTAQGSSRYVAARYEWRLLDRVGHFPHVESPDVVTGAILEWLKD